MSQGYQDTDDRFPYLFEPISLGGLELPNRVVMAPMGNLLHDADGFTTEAMVTYMGERGQGGAGAVFGPFAAVSPGHTTFRAHDDRAIPGLKLLASSIAAGGSIPFLQIAHQGANRPSDPMAPSKFYSRFYRGGMPREMSKKDIEQVSEQFAAAAERGITAGFRGIELHAALGYLVGSFYSPHANRRSDAFGGIQGGLRFVERIARAIRRRCGDIPLGAKINAHEHVLDGIKASDVPGIARAFEESGFDFLHVAAASSSAHHCKVCGVSPIYRSRHYLNRAELASQVKRHVSIPVIADGGIGRPDQAEEILQQGLADMVSIGRAFIADPHWLAHIEEGSAYRPCIRCNICHIRQTLEKVAVRCSVNPWAGRESTHPGRPAPHALSIAVVGGGPAGIQAALTAADRGHAVILFERDETLGGKMRPASVPRFKGPMREYLDYLVKRLGKTAVDVRLETDVLVQDLTKLKPDAVILGTGSRPIDPAIPGLARSATRFAASFLDDPSWIQAGERVAVVGASKVGCEVAWFIHEECGAKPLLIDLKPFEELMIDEYPRDRVDLLTTIVECGIPLRCSRTPEAVRGSDLLLRCEDDTVEAVSFDKALIAVGAQPNRDLALACRSALGNVPIREVGDCVETRNVYHALQEGFLAGYELGED